MIDTCRGLDKCAVARRLKIKQIDECPNHIFNVFVDNKNEKTTVSDCASIRTMLMIQDLHNRMTGVQKSMEQQRNNTMPVLNLMGRVLEAQKATFEVARKAKSNAEIRGEVIDVGIV